MRIITRRRVKVRVTVRRGDGSVTSHGWAYHRKREDDSAERKQGERGDGEGVTPVESHGESGESVLTPDPYQYDVACDDKDLNVELEEDADYEDASGLIYKDLDKDSERIYEEVGKKGMRVRFEGENGVEKSDEDEVNSSLYSKGAIPKRDSSSTLDEDEEKREASEVKDEIKKVGDQDEESNLYESIENVNMLAKPQIPKDDDREYDTFTRESETCIYDFDEPRKIEVTVTSKRDSDDHDRDSKTGNAKPQSKKRGKVEVKFSPWQTEGSDKKTKTPQEHEDNVKVEQRTKLSYSNRSGPKQGKEKSADSPYKLQHRSSIEVSTENVPEDDENDGNDATVKGEKVEGKRSRPGHWGQGGDDSGDDDGEKDCCSDDDRDSQQPGRRRVKKRTLIRVRGAGVDKDGDLDDGQALVKTFSRTVVTFGGESGGSEERARDTRSDHHSSDRDKSGHSNSATYHSSAGDVRQEHPAARCNSGSASPSLGRKEYRKVTYDGTSTLQRRPSQENVSVPKPEESFAWKDINVEKVARSPTSSLPKVQNPTVTLLQKKRDDPHSTSEGQIPGKRPEYLKPDDIGPKYKPDDKLYVIKREYESEDEEGGRRFAVLGPKKVQGVGPTTTEGVPTTLKSGVKSEHQGEWYRRMFDSLHKVKDARYGGYLSEPEGYDSDIGSSRYATLDRRRQHHFEVDPMTSSLPRDYNVDLDPFSRNTNRYVHQPGRIEDYIPGYSSLSEKELKKNPEADVKLESQSQEPPPVSVNHRYGSQKMSMTHALKESGYESDSTLVFRKREDARRQAPDPRKTSQVYRQIQRGGDIPFTGLQKTNPPKPREPVVGPLPFHSLYGGQHQAPPARPESPYKYESGEVNIHYRTPVRIEQKEAIPEEELARRQEEHMKKVYENERRKKYLAELEDIERRRHTDNFTPLQKSPIPLNRYDDESSLGTMRGARTPDLKQVAKSLYNFTAQNKRELSFNKGEVIFIRRQIDKNWYEGELRGSVGIFPCNYVEIVPYESIKTLTRKPTEGQARARFNFQAQTSMEMSLSKGELVVLTRRVDENWYEGRIGNRKGIFPVSYVDTLVEPGSDRPMTPSSSPMPRPALPAANLLYNGASSYSSPYSTLGRPGSQNDSRPYNQSLTVNTQQEPVAYRALYNYKPQNDDELELLESDVVMVMEKCDDGWFVGTSRRTGLFGTFPGNYVERV